MKKIIYHCYGGTHSSVTAASVHLGLLPADRVPTREMLWKISLYDRQEANQHGHIFFMGTDEAGNEVYIAARRNRPEVLEGIFTGLADIFRISHNTYMLVNVMHEVNLTMKFGGFLSRRWGFIRIGRPIVTLGTQNAYFRVVELVQDVKRRLREHDKKNTLLQRQQVSPGRAGRCDSHRQPSVGEGAKSKRNMGPAVFEYKKERRGKNPVSGK